MSLGLLEYGTPSCGVMNEWLGNNKHGRPNNG